MVSAKKQAEIDARLANIRNTVVETSTPMQDNALSPLVVLDKTRKALKLAHQEADALKNKKVKIADLHEVAGRKRTLKPEDFEQLKTNLLNNPLVNPIVVRPRAEGGFEIISGHNRVQAYRELGRQEIEADIREFEEDKVFEAAFYSNLINSELSDYEKYLGFKKIQLNTSETQKDIAKRAGVSQSLIAKIFAFDRFTETTKKILETHPHILGCAAAQRMANANEQRVVPALKKLIAGECTESQAVSLALTGNNERPVKLEPILIRSGKKTFAEIKVNKGLVAITLKDEERVAELLEQVQLWLQEAAKS